MAKSKVERKNKEKTDEEFITESLWKIIGRFDHLTESTNTKAALIIAFNTFVFGGIVLKGSEILPDYYRCSCLAVIGIILLTAAAIASILSLWWTCFAIKPIMYLPKDSNYPRSLLFFKDVAELDKDEYYKKVNEMSNNSLNEDLACQIHILSKRISDKFCWLKKATCSILYAQIPLLSMFFIVKIIEFLSIHEPL